MKWPFLKNIVSSNDLFSLFYNKGGLKGDFQASGSARSYIKTNMKNPENIKDQGFYDMPGPSFIT